jgi:hypothetical protein
VIHKIFRFLGRSLCFLTPCLLAGCAGCIHSGGGSGTTTTPPTMGTINVTLLHREGSPGVQCTGSATVSATGPGGTKPATATFDGLTSGGPGPYFCSANTSLFPLSPGSWTVKTNLCPASCANVPLTAGTTVVKTITCPDSTCQ